MNNSKNLLTVNSQSTHETKSSPRYPKLILEHIFAFAPNKDTLGGTSYLLIHPQGNILIDCPPWQEFNQQFCHQQGGIKYLLITNRNGISKDIRQIKQDLNCDVLIQEQEAYLLTNLQPVTFEQDYQIYDDCHVFWTCGYSPASSCLYTSIHQGVLFSGRHLLPISPSEIVPLHLKKTFHWPRQIKSVAFLQSKFKPDNLQYILPGANTGYLRGKGYIDRAYEKLTNLDLEELAHSKL
jgi:hypothetical protein